MATASLSASSLHAVLGDSLRLRDEALAVLLAQWSGPVKRATEPDDLGRLVLDLSTASLFEEPALWVVRAGLPYLRKQRETLLSLAGQPVAAGAMVLVCPRPERNDALGPLLKALAKAGAVHDVEPPDARQLVDWLAHRLLLPGAPAVERPRQLAESLVASLGDDCDGLLGALETLATYCGGSPITPEAVAELCGGTAARPVWDFTDAFISGDARRAIGLLHATGADRPESFLSALISELRKLLACAETDDDGQAAAWAGLRGRPNLYHSRKHVRSLGRPVIVRLLHGAIQAQRQLRQGGANTELAVESLVLHAQRLVKGRVR